MLATRAVRRGHARPSRLYLEIIGALTLVLVVTLITTSCGTIAQANGNSGNSLIISGPLPPGAVHQPYNAVLAVGGGSSPYHFSVSSGALPPGLSLNTTTGSFTGQPSESGLYAFEVEVSDSPGPDHGSREFMVPIGGSGGGGGGGITVGVSPASVTVGSGGSQQFTATVSGTPDTAVTWTASAGSVNSHGYYIAPVVQKTTQATVTATSQADSTKSASSAVTISLSQGQSLQITTPGLPQGQQGESYTAGFAASGGTPPYSWTISSGTLPSGITLNTNGSVSGVPTATGTSNFTVVVTDAKNLTANGGYSLSVAGGSGYDGPAQLPLVTVSSAMADSPAPGSVVNVGAGGNLQTALNNAQCGDTIQLQAGVTFTGKFIVPAKGCDANHWIIIRTSTPDSGLPAEGTRMTPCYAGVGSLPGRPAYSCSNPTNVLAKVEIAQPADGPFQLASGANFYRFIGLEITHPTGVKNSPVLISTQGTADHIILDRSWLHGNPQDETANGFGMNGGTYIAVIDSYFSDFHCIASSGSCTDAHAVSGGTGNDQDGPYKIQDNFLESSGEAIMFGGGPATKTPTDIEILGNHFWKPWQWMKGNPQFVGGADGNPFIVKNHLELKNAVRVLIEANLMENNWGGFGQDGHAVLITPKNQHSRDGGNVCPLCQVTDVTMRYDQISHAGGGLQLATSMSGNGGNGGPALAGTRWSIHDLVIDDLSKNYTGPGAVFEIVNGWPKNPLNTVTINHVTAFPDPASHMMTLGNKNENEPMYGLVITNNLILTGQYPIWDALAGEGTCSYGDIPLTSIVNCFTTYQFQNNGLIASPPHFPPSQWPTGNFFPATPASVEFVNYNGGNGGNYALQSTSAYKNKGMDGKDLGADIAGLAAALAGVE
jgi:hypothetical protein